MPTKPVNKPLVIFTLFFISFASLLPKSELVGQDYPFRLLVGGALLVLLLPVLVLWVKALWNGVIPAIAGWKEINFWESAALTALFALLTGL